MKKRKRHFVYIVPCQQSSILKKYLMQLYIFCNPDKLAEAVEACTTPLDKEDLISIRNTLALYKALTNERHRDCFISLEGFDAFKEKYPYYILNSERQHTTP